MSDTDLLQVMGNDAFLWADKCTDALETFYGSYSSEVQKDEVRDLLLGWFANAMCAERDFLTFVQAIAIAESRIHFHEVTGVDRVEGGTEVRLINPAYRELTIAKHKLEEAQMWFTRALAIRQGKFNPADLEADDG